MLLRKSCEQSSATSLNEDTLVMPWLVEHARCILSRCQKGCDGKTPFERPTQEFVPFGEKVLARNITTDPMIWNAKQQCRVFHRECRRCIQSS